MAVPNNRSRRSCFESSVGFTAGFSFFGGMREVFVCCEERQIAPDGRLRRQCILFRALTADLNGSVEQGWIDCEVSGHV
ncbi:MAG: hypothetical protein LC098_08445 [Burkholderiales bacterium]|nr:hypothetical protein [Burkholderiales bacterium]